jgi:hypothetical protein
MAIDWERVDSIEGWKARSPTPSDAVIAARRSAYIVRLRAAELTRFINSVAE